MDRVRRAAYVVQIADSAEEKFGSDGDATLLDAYARESVLELWMTRGNLTVAAARQMLHQVRQELARRRTQPTTAVSQKDGEPLAA